MSLPRADLRRGPLVLPGRVPGQAGHAGSDDGRASGIYSPRGLNGDMDMLLFPIQHGTLYFVGFDVLPPFVAYAVARSTPEKREEYLRTYAERLQALADDHADPVPAAGGVRRDAATQAGVESVILQHERIDHHDRTRPQDIRESAYEDRAPWDIGRPQKAFLNVADWITGSILDAGCGTGENALYFAGRGRRVTGIDFLEEPIQRAQRKAAERGVQATFLVKNALALKDLPEVFDSVIDSGLFHVFSDDDRKRYVEGLATVLKPGGRCS